MMVTGKVSSENISGPIGIAQYAKDSFDIGLMSFLSLLAVLSISIGILNLLFQCSMVVICLITFLNSF